MIRFRVIGSDGAKGYCKVTIPKELFVVTVTVSVDGIPIDNTLIQNNTHSFIYFEQVVVMGDVVITVCN